MLTPRIYIKDIINNLLPWKDIRTVKKWCHVKNVRVFTDPGSNRPYVYRYEFEDAYNWSQSSNQKTNRKQLKKTANQTKSSNYSVIYVPQGEYENNFLSSFTIELGL